MPVSKWFQEENRIVKFVKACNYAVTVGGSMYQIQLHSWCCKLMLQAVCTCNFKLARVLKSLCN